MGMLILKDKYGAKIPIYQARSGKIVISFGNIYLTLSKENAEKIGSSLYDIEDFDNDLYQKAYREDS